MSSVYCCTPADFICLRLRMLIGYKLTSIKEFLVLNLFKQKCHLNVTLAFVYNEGRLHHGGGLGATSPLVLVVWRHAVKQRNAFHNIRFASWMSLTNAFLLCGTEVLLWAFEDLFHLYLYANKTFSFFCNPYSAVIFFFWPTFQVQLRRISNVLRCRPVYNLQAKSLGYIKPRPAGLRSSWPFRVASMHVTRCLLTEINSLKSLRKRVKVPRSITAI